RRSRQWTIHRGTQRIPFDGAGRFINRWRSAFSRQRLRCEVESHSTLVAVLAPVNVICPAVVAPDHEVGSPAASPPQRLFAAVGLYSRLLKRINNSNKSSREVRSSRSEVKKSEIFGDLTLTLRFGLRTS